MPKREIRFGLIGCGLMGREFGSAVARWCHLLDQDVVPRLVAVCDVNPRMMNWFQENFDSIRLATTEYRELIAAPDIEAVYCAVPHNLHEQFYIDIISAGKHLMGEKPFGIDQPANARILDAARAHPQILVRCSSEFPFFPGAQKIIQFIREGRFGTILEVQAGLLHSSDLDPLKPINWKRQVATNGEYGCLGDLGMHVVHIPLRVGWFPCNVRAILSKIIRERPGPEGKLVPCETWDNAQLFCQVDSNGQNFPMLLETKRIAPGEMNTWYLRVLGTALSAEFSTKYPKTLRTLEYKQGGEQIWRIQDLGYQSVYPTITGSIFEFGFSDSILQMWAAFCDELVHGENMRGTFRCATLQETAQSHRLFTAALESHASASVVAV